MNDSNQLKIRWARKEGYQINTKTDKRFSPFNCYVGDRNIETLYQCDIKGYDIGGTDYRAGKGKPPNRLYIDSFTQYFLLYDQWSKCNKLLMDELFINVKESNYILGDFFANSETNQANVLSILLNEQYLGYKRVAVVGSRNITDYNVVEDAIKEYINENNILISCIVSGGAKGIDSLAEEYAAKHNLPKLIFPAMWKDEHGNFDKAAGFKRNQDIINTADIVIAIWDGESKGTRNSIYLAKKLNKPIKVIRNDNFKIIKPKKPMTATSIDIDKVNFPVIASCKLNGVRVTVQENMVFLKSGEPVKNKHILSKLADHQLSCFDGEIIVGDPTDKDVFKRTSEFVNSVNEVKDFHFYVYDVLYDRTTATNRVYSVLDERIYYLSYETYQTKSKDYTFVIRVNHDVIDTKEELIEFKKKAATLGYNGIVTRGNETMYRFGVADADNQQLLEFI